MSYEIVYQYHCFRVGEEQSGSSMERLVLAVEMGSNNMYVTKNKRAREWTVLAVGTEDEVLRQCVRMASECEGGNLKPGGKDCTPEQFIAKIRRVVAGKVKGGEGDWARWAPEVRLAASAQGIAEEAKCLGAVVEEEVRYGEKRLVASFVNCMKGYFEFVSKHHMDMYGWSLASVSGLRES